MTSAAGRVRTGARESAQEVADGVDSGRINDVDRHRPTSSAELVEFMTKRGGRRTAEPGRRSA